MPPGLDELVALVSLLDAVLRRILGQAGTDLDLIVVDTAPTGHTLRLLALPEMALAWDHALLSLLLKYREVRAPGPWPPIWSSCRAASSASRPCCATRLAPASWR